jgi:uncharacterized protein YdaU (DUF1376 family)
MKKSLSWFPFFVDDYLGGTSAMLVAEHGAYLLAMLAQWQTAKLQAIPDNSERLIKICGGKPMPPAVREKFISVVIDGEPYLRNEKLAAIWEHQKTRHDRQSEAGKLRAKQAAKLPAKTPAKLPRTQNPEYKSTKSTHSMGTPNSIPCESVPSENKESNKFLSNAILSPGGDVSVIFSHWQKVHNHPDARLDEKRKNLIKQRLKDYSVDDLKCAIDGCKVSPHHQGQNDQGMIYDDITLILRDATHVEQFIGYVKRGFVKQIGKEEQKRREIEKLYESYGNEKTEGKQIH